MCHIVSKRISFLNFGGGGRYKFSTNFVLPRTLSCTSSRYMVWDPSTPSGRPSSWPGCTYVPLSLFLKIFFIYLNLKFSGYTPAMRGYSISVSGFGLKEHTKHHSHEGVAVL